MAGSISALLFCTGVCRPFQGSLKRPHIAGYRLACPFGLIPPTFGTAPHPPGVLTATAGGGRGGGMGERSRAQIIWASQRYRRQRWVATGPLEDGGRRRAACVISPEVPSRPRWQSSGRCRRVLLLSSGFQKALKGLKKPPQAPRRAPAWPRDGHLAPSGPWPAARDPRGLWAEACPAVMWGGARD